jgi:hypothetical protein
MALAARTTVTKEAIRKLVPALWGKPRIAAYLQSLTEEIQELETAIFAVIDSRLLDNATGARLRTLGKIVGQKNFGWSDDDLRAAIRARIRANLSDGLAQDIKHVAALLAPGVDTKVKDGAEPLTVFLRFLGPITTIRAALVDIQSDTKTGGVRLFVQRPFTFDTFTWKRAADASDPALGWDDGTGFGGAWADTFAA